MSWSRPARLGLLVVETQLHGHDAAQVADLLGVLQDVLGVAGAVLELPQELDDLGMEAVHPGVERGFFPGGADLLFHFLGDLGDDLFDAPGVDAAVGDEALEAACGPLPGAPG